VDVGEGFSHLASVRVLDADEDDPFYQQASFGGE
jgi:hypothetical protein